MRRRAGLIQAAAGLALLAVPFLWATAALAPPLLGAYVVTSLAILVFGLVVA